MEGWVCSPPAVHRRALSPVPAGDCAGLKLPGSALNPVATHLCRSFLLRAKPLCRLTATQNIQGSQFNHQRLMEKTHSPSPQILLQMALSSAGAAQGSQDSFYCLPGFCFPPPSFSPPLCLAVCALYTWCTHHTLCACVHLCVHVCRCVPVSVCKHVCCVYLCDRVPICMYIFVCAPVCMYLHVCIYVCMCISVYMCMCVLTCTRVHVCALCPCITCVHACIYVYMCALSMYLHMCICVSMWMCVFVCVHV